METLAILAAAAGLLFFGNKLPNVLWSLIGLMLFAIPCQGLIFLTLVIISDHTPITDLFPGLLVYLLIPGFLGSYFVWVVVTRRFKNSPPKVYNFLRSSKDRSFE